LFCIGQELGGEQFDQWLNRPSGKRFFTGELAAEIVSMVKASLGFVREQSGCTTNYETQPRSGGNVDRSWTYRPSRAMNAETQTAESKNQAPPSRKAWPKPRQKIQELEAALRASKTPSAPAKLFFVVSRMGRR